MIILKLTAEDCKTLGVQTLDQAKELLFKTQKIETVVETPAVVEPVVETPTPVVVETPAVTVPTVEQPAVATVVETPVDPTVVETKPLVITESLAPAVAPEVTMLVETLASAGTKPLNAIVEEKPATLKGHLDRYFELRKSDDIEAQRYYKQFIG